MNEEDDDHRSPGPHSNLMIDIPPGMIVEIATGLEPPHEIAARYGYSQDEYTTIQSMKWFQRALSSAIEEQHTNGWTLNMKMRVMAETMLVNTYHAARASESVQNKLDVAKYLSKLADLEPKPNQTAHSESGFNIIINIPDYGQTDKQTITLEGTAHDPESFDHQKPGYIRLPVYVDDLADNLAVYDDNESA